MSAGRARDVERWPEPRFVPVADHAILVCVADEIDDEAHGSVLTLDRALAASSIPGVRAVVPALVNLLVEFDPELTDHGAVERAVRALRSGGSPPPSAPACHEVEVCYDHDVGPDLADVATACDLTSDDVVAAHLGGTYRVLMYGFAPGYAYLAGVVDAIRVPRKPTAVRDVPAGSVIIAGTQCLITTLDMPTGWSVIGRSPTRILPTDLDEPFLFDPGDEVRFVRIERDELDRREATGDDRGRDRSDSP